MADENKQFESAEPLDEDVVASVSERETPLTQDDYEDMAVTVILDEVESSVAESDDLAQDDSDNTDELPEEASEEVSEALDGEADAEELVVEESEIDDVAPAADEAEDAGEPEAEAEAEVAEQVEAVDEAEVDAEAADEPEAADGPEADDETADEAEADAEVDAEPEAIEEAAYESEPEASVEAADEPEVADDAEPEADGEPIVPEEAATEAETTDDALVKQLSEDEDVVEGEEAVQEPEASEDSAEPEVSEEPESEFAGEDAPVEEALEVSVEAPEPETKAPEASVEDDETFDEFNPNIPSVDVLEAELSKERHRSNWFRALRSTLFSLVVVAAAAVLIAMLVLPVLQITGTSMTNTLNDKDIVVALRGSSYETGDIIAFYYNNNILIKRVIAGTGQWVDITDDGTVYVDGVRLDEPYVTEKALGDCNIALPYQVPEGKIFVMGDHRSTSLDSRNSALGCISTDMVVGRLLFRAWPINQVGTIN